MREAMLYETLTDQMVVCHLCAHQCCINQAKRGICGVRENREGVLYALTYGQLIAENVDPIEKKPLFHVYPASKSFSIATAGCNFSCEFCQNHDISQLPREGLEIPGKPTAPAAIVERAIRTGSRTISYTYTEPTIYFEYAYETACLAHERGLKNVFVTNGFMTDKTLETIAPYLQAANVDLKSFRDDFYRKRCGARLAPVLESLGRMKELGIWVEVTTLLIPGLNDGEDELNDIASFILSLGSETPWHISRFHPRYLMSRWPATPVAAIHRAVETGRSCGLKYVYSGNIPGDEGENTFCFHCGQLLIGRSGFHIEQMNLNGSACSRCGTPLEGIF
ncbi:MAG: AmmeMemoRadiSam system radical SAM enzyme [Deltaproteobacteria bacterium HGW-Deltaproteobacteria-11]|nr:MAG: AmmeMemoRadiSam system radical SAM enzyme [Deltaproteobacteria bacterium HGW-Deltaproteobacteria-11]